MLNKKGAADYIIPMLVVLFASVIGIIVLLTLTSAEENERGEAVQNYDSGFQIVRELNNFLEKETVFQGEEKRIIDFLATANDEDDDLVKFLREQVRSHFSDTEVWWFKLIVGDERVFSTGDVELEEEARLRTIGYSCQDAGSRFQEYKIKLPKQGEIMFCYVKK